MKINKAYKFRIYPDKKQTEYIEGCFNACRYVYNVSLDCERQLYQLGAKSDLSAFGLMYHLPSYKISDTWLKNYDSHALAYEMENLSNSFKKFFSGGGYPKFKSKKDSIQSFRTRKAIEVLDNAIKIPKLSSPIETVIHRKVEGKPKQMTISRKNGKYYVSIMCEIDKEITKLKMNKDVGIDIGVTHFLITDDGKKIDNPKVLRKFEEHLKKLQQSLSRTNKNSKNRERLKLKISKLHEHISNYRKNFLHNVSRQLVDENDTIYMEDLNVSGMTRSSKGTIEKPGKMVKQKSGLNKSILDVSLGEFKVMLEYKTKFADKKLIKVDRFFASSKICNKCGHKNTDLKLSDRIWFCKCGEKLDRDVNAAINIKKEGKKLAKKKIS
jgi:putative transposase